MTKLKEYTMYKGEELLAIGNRKELAEKFKVAERTISFYGTPTYQKRGTGKNRKVLVCLED
jgi:hypothetical protein